VNIGRRQFLKFLGLATAGIAIEPLAAIVENGNYFVNRKLGFGFNVPKGWEVDAFGDFTSLCGKQCLLNFEEDFSKELVEELSDGLVAVIRKYPDSIGGTRFNPSVTFYMSPDDVLDEFDTFESFVESAVDTFELVLTDYEVIEEPKPVVGKNFEALTYKAKFLFEHEDISSILIDDETWVIHHNGLIYTIHMYDTPYANDVARNEFKELKNSLHIA